MSRFTVKEKNKNGDASQGGEEEYLEAALHSLFVAYDIDESGSITRDEFFRI